MLHVQTLEQKDLIYEKQYNVLGKRLLPWTAIPDAPFAGAWAEVPRGDTSTPHNHDENEMFFIVEGTGTVLVGDETRRVRAGDVIFIPPFKEHSITNDGDERLLFLTLFWGGSEDWRQQAPAGNAS